MVEKSAQGSRGMVADLISQVSGRGVRLSVDGGRLRYEAPTGALTREDMQRLRANREELVALLQADYKHPADPRPWDRPTPLSYSQLAHWQVYRLNERRHLREISFATRLHGRLDLEVLRQSIAENIRRQEALRTRIIVVDGAPMQLVEQGGGDRLLMDDLTTLPEHLREGEIQRRIEEHVGEPIDVTIDPLFAVRLLRVGSREHVLIIAMEHIISDGFSRNLILRDILGAYSQLLKSDRPVLPEIGTTLRAYALEQCRSEQSWLRTHGAYWEQRLRGCERLRFPRQQMGDSDDAQMGWGIVPIRIGSQLTAELRAWCRSKRTTAVMAVFAAYVALVLRWCNVSQSVIRFQSNGRMGPDLENTIGYFAFALYLRMEVGSEDSFIDLVGQVTREYCNAYEHTDASYLETRVPRPDLAQSTAFNWLPRRWKSDPVDASASDGELVGSLVPFEHPVFRMLDWDCEPIIALMDTDEDIVGRVAFPRNRFSKQAMERFARGFFVALETLLRRPGQRIRDLELP